MRDHSLKFVLAFTAVYGLLGLCLLAGQPRAAAMQTADAGGNFEAPAATFSWFKVMLASAE
jgi:hypothetical protein